MSTNKDWESWGKDNPYYGVISDDKFLGKQLDNDHLEDFYRLGRMDIEKTMQRLADFMPHQKKPFKHAVDYGCGVGRLTVALSHYAKAVTGYDVSPSMIKAAQAYASGYKNVSFELVDGAQLKLPTTYDMLNSYIVFQHIPPKVGYGLLRQLFDGLESKGCFAIQLTFGYNRSLIGKILLKLRENVPVIRYLANIARGRKFNTPNMRMHSYDLNEVHRLLFESRITSFRSELTDHGGYRGVYLFGQKD